MFNLWKSLGIEKKKAPDTTALTNAMRPFQSLTEIPVGASLNEMILKGLKGQGWGYAPEFVERTTSPVVAQREARFKQEEMPYLSSELSGRGLGRSSIAGQAIGRAGGAKERDINELIAKAYLENEQQKKLDESRYQELGKWYTGAESGQRSEYAAEDARRTQYALEKELGYQNEKETERIQNINRTIGLALSAGGGDLTEMINQIKEAMKVNASQPFTKRVQNTAYTGFDPASFAPSALSFGG